jgi:hypothetical protein
MKNGFLLDPRIFNGFNMFAGIGSITAIDMLYASEELPNNILPRRSWPHPIRSM